MIAPRIVSLLPSATEIVAALGLGENLVGRSHECDFPAGVEKLPILSAPKIRTDGSSLAIDKRVRAVLEEGLSMYEVDEERLRELDPDFVLTQTQCAVCAVTPDDLDAALCDWTGRARLLSLEPDNLDDVWREIREVGRALGVSEAGDKLVDGALARLAALRERTASLRRPTVATIEWIDPLMAGGNWMPELIETAGGNNLFGENGVHSPCLDWVTLDTADPEFILVTPCGFDIERSVVELRHLAGRPEWEALSAFKNGRVYVIDGHQFFNRPGPRLVESAEIVAEILHPEHFDFGHRGADWIVFSQIAGQSSR